MGFAFGFGLNDANHTAHDFSQEKFSNNSSTSAKEMTNLSSLKLLFFFNTVETVLTGSFKLN